MMEYLVNMNRHLRITILLLGFFTSAIIMPFTENFWFLFFVLAFTFLGLLFASNISHGKNYSNIMEKSLEDTLTKINFDSDYSYLGDDYLSGIALNKIESKIIILRKYNKEDEFTPYFYNFSDILECSIKEDGDTVTKTVSSSLIGRAMAGGILFGGIGAAAGALSGEKIASEKIFKATLEIVFDDIDYPIHEIDFLNSNMLVNRNGTLYQKMYADLNKWNKTISVLIKRNERELNSKSV